MIPKLPESFYAIARSGRKVFLKEIAPAQMGDCENCGGMGRIYIFVAESGPFRDPPAVGHDLVLTSMDDEMYGYVWYLGKTTGGECPVCRGLGKSTRLLPPASRQLPTGAAIRQVTEQMSQ